MAGAGGEPRDFRTLVIDVRKRLVALERRQRGDVGPPVGGVVGFVADAPPGWMPLDGRTVQASAWPLLVEVLAPGATQAVLPTVAPMSGMTFYIRAA